MQRSESRRDEGLVRVPQCRQAAYDERYTDTYVIDTDTGMRRLIAKKHGGTATWSPDGKYAAMFDGKDWIVTLVSGAGPVNLTAKLGVNFWNEETDTPSTPRAYGMAGWTVDGKYILLYDRFDFWRVAADGSSAKNHDQRLRP